MTDRLLTSSPLSSARSTPVIFATASPEARTIFRQAQPLPYELLKHVYIYLEESLFLQAFRLLFSLSSAPIGNGRKGIPIPPPECLAVIATLTIHPDLTTRAKSEEQLSQPNSALRYLRTITKLTGPIHANLAEAYRFRKFDDAYRSDDSSETLAAQTLTIKYADSSSLFTSKDDFWAVVGWALNCSCLTGPHVSRWTYWRPWLDHMLDVLETDWSLREDDGTCHQSILWQYISQATGGNAKARRLLRAIFADGSQNCITEFGEVFRKELRGPKNNKQSGLKQEAAVNVDEEIYGDWLKESESSSEEDSAMQIENGAERASKRIRTRTPSTRRRKTPGASKHSTLTDNDDSDASSFEHGSSISGLGLPESITIRLRLLQLLADASAQQALRAGDDGLSWPGLRELYTLFVEFVQHLPLPVFQQFVLPTISSASLRPDTRVALCEFILQCIASHDGRSISYTTLESMTLSRLVEQYLGQVANKSPIEWQTKMSLLLESILRQMRKQGTSDLTSIANLAEVVNEGIRRREAKAADVRESAKYKKGSNHRDEELAYQMLLESGARIAFITRQLDR